MEKDDKEFLDGIRNQIEFYLCKREGIKSEVVEEFIKQFEKMREDYPGMVGNMDAGAHENAPHHKHYLTATRIKEWLESQMKLNDETKQVETAQISSQGTND